MTVKVEKDNQHEFQSIWWKMWCQVLKKLDMTVNLWNNWERRIVLNIINLHRQVRSRGDREWRVRPGQQSRRGS